MFFIPFHQELYSQNESIKFELIAEYQNLEEFINESHILVNQSPIVVETDRIDFYGKNPRKTAIKSLSKNEIQFPPVGNGSETYQLFFEIFDDLGLLVTQKEIIYNAPNDVKRTMPIRSILFDCEGKEIKSFGDNINFVTFSPSGDYFVATLTGSVTSDTLYFFSTSGKLLKSVKREKPIPRFSQSGDYVIVVERGKDVIDIFTKEGEHVLKTNLWTDFQVGLLFNIFIIDSRKSILVSTCLPEYRINLIDLNLNEKWESNFNRVLSAFVIDNHSLVLHTVDETKPLGESLKSVWLLNLDSGESTDKIQNCDLINVSDNKVYIKKGGSYYVYETSYDFPIKPGMPEWKELKSYPEILEAIQVPKSILDNMSTIGLVETILRYPDNINILAHRNYQEGFDIVVKRFNGYKELITRVDAGTTLIGLYKQFTPSSDITLSAESDLPSVFDYLNIELLLAQHEIIDKLSKDEMIELCDIAIDKYESKKNYNVKYGNLTKLSSSLIIVRTISKLDDKDLNQLILKNSQLQQFAEDGRFIDVSLMDNLIYSVSDLIQTKFK